ncbi:hypothetical protein [Acrocarpospora sp. B8E8]|uniref:hypothetical protein n=1 Tax=Acrocarpospora sp. B8E8 TaxID=3153572 RepID=UPI00325F92CB
MPVQIHPSSPARVSDTTRTDGSTQTASFTPPFGSLLVAAVHYNTQSAEGSNPTITMSASPSTAWTPRAIPPFTSGFGYVALFTAPAASSAPTTVTATSNRLYTISLKVYVVTGHHPATPIAATGTGNIYNNPATFPGYTSTRRNSLGLLAATDWDNLGPATSADVLESAAVNGGASGGSISVLTAYKAASTPTPGTAVTFTADSPGTIPAPWTWAAIEILPAPYRGWGIPIL